MTKRLYIICLLCFFLQCRTKNEPVVQKVPEKKNIVVHENPDDVYDDVKDSAELEKLYNDALAIAAQRKQEKEFEGMLDTVEKGNMSWYGTCHAGHLFSGDKTHLLVKRISSFHEERTYYADIFLLKDGRFVKAGSDTSGSTFEVDTLRDVNGDGYKDLVISSYSSAGCCPRSDDHCMVYNPATGLFVLSDFFNPEYQPGKKIVYTMDYGYMGAVSFFKYKWNGVKSVLVEELRPMDTGPAGGMTPVKFQLVSYPSERMKVTRYVPEEYKKLDQYWYFMAKDKPGR